MKRIWVLAGTTEGRELCELLLARRIPFLATVATPYGAQLIQTIENSEVRIGKLNAREMSELIQTEGIVAAIDATHPYAAQASTNAKEACRGSGIPYLRLQRPETTEGMEKVVRVRSIAEAAAFLNENEGNALITTGGNGIAEYAAVRDFSSRLYVRVLPDSSAIARCEELGFSAGHIIAMRGPFSEELNIAMMNAVHARYLVTKDGGAAGGMAQKLSAAEKTGATLVLIERPQADVDETAPDERVKIESTAIASAPSDSSPIESAVDFAQKVLIESPGQSEQTRQDQPKCDEALAKALFPLFIDVYGKKTVVVGGGAVGARRAEVLASFGAVVHVIAPMASGELQRMIHANAIYFAAREYQAGDCSGAAIVVAATNDRAVNAAIALEAKAQSIPVSVADAPDEATFHFPAIVREGSAVLGLTTGDPSRTKRIAAKLRQKIELFV